MNTLSTVLFGVAIAVSSSVLSATGALPAHATSAAGPSTFSGYTAGLITA